MNPQKQFSTACMMCMLFFVTFLSVEEISAQVFQLVKDIRPGTNAVEPHSFIVNGGKLYFMTREQDSVSLFTTDGTASGTTRLYIPSFRPSAPIVRQGPIVYNGKVYYMGVERAGAYSGLGVTDGTLAGTQMVATINANDWNANFSSPNVINGKLYFSAYNGTINQLWQSDGTTTIPISDNMSWISTPEITVFQNKLYFPGEDQANGVEIWSSDGTTAGTQLLKNIEPSWGNATPIHFKEYNSRLYFGTMGYGLWSTDGTGSGTLETKDNSGNTISQPAGLLAANGKLFFSASNSSGLELWVSDGTSAGTFMLKDIHPTGSAFSQAMYGYEWNNRIFFQAYDGTTGWELWTSDGTANGTFLLKDINPNGGSYPAYFTPYNGKLYFKAADDTMRYNLWVTDGTTGGTLKVANPASTALNPLERSWGFIVYDGSLYFSAAYDNAGNELWKLTTPVQTLVWPGDANADGIADNQDVLAIGIAYGASGTARPNATTSWTGQSCPDWVDTFALGTNYKHADCNGEGIIDSNDISVIALNYGLTHQKGGFPEGMAGADLYLEFAQDSANAGDTITGSLYLGTSAVPVNNVYGIAFSLTYDQNIVDTNSFRIDFTNSWFTPNNNRISLTKDFYLASKIDAGLSRIDHTNISGAGKIADVSFVIQDNIDGKDFLVLPLEIQFENVVAIDKDEATVSLSANGDTLYVKDEISGITSAEPLRFSVFPNPALNEIQVVADFPIANYSLTDLTGKQVLQGKENSGRNLSIDISELEQGSYFLNLQSAGQYTTCKKIVVLR